MSFLSSINKFFFPKNNIQIHQTLWLSIILFFWVYFYWLDISFLEILTVFLSVIIFDLLLIKHDTWKFIFPFSWVNAWFWISFFLRTDDLIIYVFAAFLAILLKRIFRISQDSNLYKWLTKGRHFLNPSNAAVFLTLILFPLYSWTNPLQWWQSVWIEYYLLAILLIFWFWILIEWRLKNILNINYLDVIISILLTHLLLFFTITNESLSSALLFFNWAFFIFIFFQVTDPKTIPEKRLSRILYWVWIWLMFYLLWYFINENYALLWSLFFMTFFLPFIWKYEKIDVWKYFNKWDIFLLIIIFILIVSILYMIYSYWIPDLVFDNRCNQLFCR